MSDNQHAKYKTGEVNAFRADCIISREKLNNKLDYVYTRDYESGEEYNKGVTKRRNSSTVNKVGEVEGKEHEELKKRNGTGGKSIYTKVYAGELLKLSGKMSLELFGFCLLLTPYVEWETGHLVCGYGKKKEYMTQRDMSRKLKMSIGTTNRIINELKSLDIIGYDESKYKLSTKFFAKGMVTNED